jgi:Domain of unknown function (DUF4203)
LNETGRWRANMLNSPIPFVGSIVGVALLFFGRKLFWLFVAAIGFAAGMEIAPQITHNPSPIFVLVIALAAGVLGAILSIVIQKFAIAVAGFIAGGRLAIGLSAAFYMNHAEYSLFIFLIGGILGAILLLFLFDWALILLTSVEGAHLISGMIVLPQMGCMIVLIVLIVIGVVAQGAMLQRYRRSEI